MTLRVVLLDMIELSSFSKGWHLPVEVSHPLVKCWIARPDLLQIALKVLVVYGVEADDRRVQTNVGFRDVLAKVIGPALLRCKMSFGFVQGLEEGGHVLFVCFLCSIVKC